MNKTANRAKKNLKNYKIACLNNIGLGCKKK